MEISTIKRLDLDSKTNFTYTKPKKDWWVHLRSGLVMDESGKHRQAMGQAVWLYLYFLLTANRRNGMVFRRISTIERETGFNKRSIGRWLKTLRDQGYIRTYSTGRFLHIAIYRWRSIGRQH